MRGNELDFLASAGGVILALFCVGFIFLIATPLFRLIHGANAKNGRSRSFNSISTAAKRWLASSQKTVRAKLPKAVLGAAIVGMFSLPVICTELQECLIYLTAICFAVLVFMGFFVFILPTLRILIREGVSARAIPVHVVRIVLGTFIIGVAAGFGDGIVYGGPCETPPSAAPQVTMEFAEQPDAPFSPGTKIKVTKPGLSIHPSITGYCLHVGVLTGATATVAGYVPPTRSGELQMMVIWDEQDFKEHSLQAYILGRHIRLRPFVSDIPVEYAEMDASASNYLGE